MTSRPLFLVLGLGLFALAVLELAAPGVLPIPVSEGLLAVFGLIVLAYAYTVVRLRRSRGPDPVRPPDVELPRLTTVPGEQVDTVLETFPGTDAVDTTSLSSLRSGLRQAAVTVLTRYASYSEQEATDAVRAGTWTSDTDAGEFLGDSGGSVTDRARRERLVDRSIDAVVSASNLADDSGDEPTDEPDDVEATGIDPDTGSTPANRRVTHHWLGVGFVVLVGLGVGTLTRSPGVLLGAVVGIGYAAYARSTPVGAVDLSVERSVSEAEPEPGEAVTVTLDVRNEGSRSVPDLRLVDGVPESLAVTDGAARHGTALRGGDSVSLSYTVTARRGSHEFGPTLALVRNRPGSVEEELYLPERTTITCRPSVQPVRESVPLRSQATQYTGPVETDTRGTGVAFQSVREYHPGDSLTRIDWNRRARTGELTTVEFAEQRAATVVILVDCRASAYVGPAATAQTAVERAVSGAERTIARLLDDGNQVGVATVGAADHWLAPGTGTSHRHEAVELLWRIPLSAPDQSTGSEPLWSHRLGRRLPETTQLLVFTPLVGPETLAQLRQFEAHGHPVTVVSPDPTAGTTPPRRLARLRRSITTTDLRQSGIPVFDWERDRPLETAFATGEGVG